MRRCGLVLALLVVALMAPGSAGAHDGPYGHHSWVEGCGHVEQFNLGGAQGAELRALCDTLRARVREAPAIHDRLLDDYLTARMVLPGLLPRRQIDAALAAARRTRDAGVAALQGGLRSAENAAKAFFDRLRATLPVRGQFVVHCRFSHRNTDDPIVFPGRPGASHVHDFFGNRTTKASTTAATLAGRATTCSRGTDRSAYWAPALFKGNKATSPFGVSLYYLRGGGYSRGRVAQFPPGLRIVAGNMRARRAQGRAITWWRCRTATRTSTRPPVCREKDLLLNVTFPSCWNGRDLDSPDHKSHMAYGRGKYCPASHPVPVPKMMLRVEYEASGGRGTGLACGSAFCGHADFFNSWSPATLQTLITRCLNAAEAGRGTESPFCRGPRALRNVRPNVPEYYKVRRMPPRHAGMHHR